MINGFSDLQWWVLVIAPALSAALTRLLMIAAPEWGLIDHPGHRKVHRDPTPLVGGLAMLATLVVCQLLTQQAPFASWSLVTALLIITVIGVADDAHELSHRSKFVAQALGGAVIVSGTSVWVSSLGDLFGMGSIDLGKWAIFVTVVSIVGVMNAVNMIDGLDGLAGSVCLGPVVLLGGLAYVAGSSSTAFELLLLAGAIVGFLAWNLRLPGRVKARVFMGDTGGMIIGMLLAWYSIKVGGSAESVIKPITAVWILSMPLLDMGGVMLLRLYQRKSPFHADQQHMHHLLLHAGYSVNQVVAIMAGASISLGVVGIAAERSGIPQPIMLILFLILWAGYVLALIHPSAVQSRLVKVVRPTPKLDGSPHT